MSFLKRKKKEEELPPQEESVESILNEIKSIVSGGQEGDLPQAQEEDDALELTEIVDSPEEEPSEPLNEEVIISVPEPEKKETSDEEKFVDVLAEIDSSLAEDRMPLEIKEEEIIIQQEVVIEEVLQEEPINQQPEEILATPKIQSNEVLAEKEVAATMPEKVMGEEEMSSEAKEALISKEKAEKSTKAIKELMDNIPHPKVDSPEFRGGSTVEDLVTESLKPMLKDWLDKNLETIVRDIVGREIRKILPREG